MTTGSQLCKRYRDHAPGRAALALDIMESVRPQVDAYVLALLGQRTLSTADLAETTTGACRLSYILAAELARTLPRWREAIAPHVERTAQLLSGRSATPLTGAAGRRAWQRRHHGVGRAPMPDPIELPATCRDCGGSLPDRRHRYCERCRRERFRSQAQHARERAARTFQALSAEQRDPRHGGHAAELRGRKNSAHQLAVRAWSGERPDPGVFTREVLPGLDGATISQLVAATGLSPGYCSLVRLGKRVPHPRHWQALRGVGVSVRGADALGVWAGRGRAG
jgi:hypothetical protein